MHSQADCLQAFSPGQFHCIDQQISVDITDQAVLIQVSFACLFPGIQIAGKKRIDFAVFPETAKTILICK
jgi:hypothetical protein